MVARPEQRGLGPDGDAPRSGADGAQETATEVTLAEALREPSLWCIAVAAGLSFAAATAILNHGPALATDAGYSARQGRGPGDQLPKRRSRGSGRRLSVKQHSTSSTGRRLPRSAGRAPSRSRAR